MPGDRRTQPYRKGMPRMPGAALTAMTRGRTSGGYNPQDAARAAMLVAAGRRKKSGRPARAKRPTRPARPSR